MAAAGGVDIPKGLDVKVHARAIADILQRILDALKNEGAQRVTSRLNCSCTEKAVPYWVGAVESSDIKSFRTFDAGLLRFGQTNRSKVYEETITDLQWGIHERDWSKVFSEKTKSPYGPGHAYGPQADCMYQLFVALRANDKEGKTRQFGTLTSAFKTKPSDKDRVDHIMKQWAGSGEYIEYLTKTIGFDLGGPRC
jgi:hypothetical protein